MKDMNTEIIGSKVENHIWEDRRSDKFVWENKNTVLVPSSFQLVNIFNEQEFKKFLKEAPERTVAGLHFEPKDSPKGNYFVFRKNMQVIIKTTRRSDGEFILRVHQRDNKIKAKIDIAPPKPKVDLPKQEDKKPVINPVGIKNDMGSVQIKDNGIQKDI